MSPFFRLIFISCIATAQRELTIGVGKKPADFNSSNQFVLDNNDICRLDTYVDIHLKKSMGKSRILTKLYRMF